ncbi:hypothetical protein E0Z06_15370 [Rheinheimera sp. D18]|uniref:NfrA family protein n=1 Tax=Rheinheimera sp. D18 TaxID=2545632 RepID=UPI0010451D5A|nr:hypothetical protein [Rheinheimera sp. D18]QBL10795.1 hypothetical protein E0Z06_15370 [Rheinheimera sp. D18]
MTARVILFLMLLINSVAVIAQDWRDGLTELQQFRTYPYVDKAFQLQQQQQFASAALELEKALQVVPEHLPFLLTLFDYQLAIPDTAAALHTYQLIPNAQREDRLLRLAQTQLDKQQVLNLKQYSSLLGSLTFAQQQQVLTLITQHLIAQQQLQSAFNWLMAQAKLSGGLYLQRAELASQLSVPQQVIADTEAVASTMLTEQDWLRYSQALLSENKALTAALVANQHAGSSWAQQFYRQWLQTQLSEQNWTAAEQSFIWLSQHAKLTEAEQMQRYQSATNANNTELALQLISNLNVSCLEKVAMYLQNTAEQQAKAQFLACPVQQTTTWLVYAERWLSADDLEAVSISNATLAKKKAEIVLQKRIAASDYRTLLQRKFAQPLRQQDYTQLVASINQLTDLHLQLNYFSVLYRTMQTDYLLDKVSYLHMQLRQPEQALIVLEQALPFSAQALAEQTLPKRLINLLQQQPEQQTAARLHKLDSWQQLVEPRAELWRLVGNCTKAQQLLAPAPNSADGWKTLALCANNQQPAAAIQYWQQAYQLQPDDTYLKQIAYQYQSMQQTEAALTQFQAVPDALLSATDKLAIAELALQTDNQTLAERYLQQAKPQLPTELARQHAIYAALYTKLQQTELALSSWHKAAKLEPKLVDYQLGYAYALADTEPEQALSIMQHVLADDYKVTATQAAQMAYLNQRLNHIQPTQLWVDKALLLYPEHAQLGNAELETQFSLVRLQQQLNSHWQISSSASITSGAVTGDNLVADSSQLAKHGMAVKAEYFTNPLQRDLSVYALVAGNGNNSPWQNGGQQFGVSYKPWQQHNIWLSAGVQQYPLAEGDWQGLLRINADLLNDAPWQSEWRPVQLDWWERKLYVDAVWWPKSDSRLAQVRFDQGPVWKLNTALAQTIKGYGLAQFDYRRQIADDVQVAVSGQQLTAGLGLQWRFWLGETPVLLQRQRFEVNLEWQYQLAGDLNQRKHALLLQFYVAW